MKHEDLIAALRRMAPETGSLHCLGCGYEHNCSLHGCAIIRAAVDEIEMLRNPPNPPLTMEELREMDGEPVWVDFKGEHGEWELVSVRPPLEGVVFLTHKNGMHTPAAIVLECGGNIYRRKPEEGSHTPVEPAVPDWAGHLHSRFMRTE